MFGFVGFRQNTIKTNFRRIVKVYYILYNIYIILFSVRKQTHREIEFSEILVTASCIFTGNVRFDVCDFAKSRSIVRRIEPFLITYCSRDEK